MKSFTTTINVQVTAEAASVAGPLPPTDDHAGRTFGRNCSVGDLVRFPNSSGWLVVLQRRWIVGPDSETLEIYLDAPDEPEHLKH